MTLPQVLATERRDNAIELDLALPDWAFEGHFPGHPVLPGVVQIDWAMAFAAEFLGLDRLSATDFRIKFRKLIRPDDQLRLSLRHDQAKATLSFEYRAAGEIVSSGSVKL